MSTVKSCYLSGYSKMDNAERFNFSLGLEAAMELADENGGEVSMKELRQLLQELLAIDEDLREASHA